MTQALLIHPACFALRRFQMQFYFSFNHNNSDRANFYSTPCQAADWLEVVPYVDITVEDDAIDDLVGAYTRIAV